jgi:hypothetical protein
MPRHVGPAQVHVGVRLAELDGRRAVLERVDEVVLAGMPALERAARAGPQVEVAAEPAPDLAVEVEVEERAGTLPRPVFRLRNGEAIQVPAGGEPSARPGHVDRPGGERKDHEEHRRRDDRVEREERPLYTPRMDERALQKDLDRQIVATHRRFVKAMDGRLGSMSVETKALLPVLRRSSRSSRRTRSRCARSCRRW